MRETILIICLVLMGICWVGMAFCLFMLRRNEQVGKYRGKIIDNIYDYNVSHQDYVAWRWKEYKSVP